ncbi:MAG: AEC family transporter [Bacteroidota bacterium]
MSFTELLTTFTDNLLPILLLSGAGFLLGKVLAIEPRSLSRILFYLFSPILVFNLLLHSALQFDQAVLTVAFAAAVMLSLIGLGFLTGRLLNLERPLLMAVMMTAAFGNTGNYGLPLIHFAFGESALAYGTLYFVTTSMFFNTLGVLMASLGHTDLKTAVIGLLRVPTVYAILLAVLITTFKIQLPLVLARTVDLAAGASIPLMLILLGLELTRVRWSHSVRAISLGVVLRLVAGPLVGLLLAIPFGLDGPARQGNLVQTGVPAAVTNTVIASEYGLEPTLVTAIIFVGTLVSPLTLTPLLVLLGG